MVKPLIYQHLTQNNASEPNICAVDQLRGRLVEFCRCRRDAW